MTLSVIEINNIMQKNIEKCQGNLNDNNNGVYHLNKKPSFKRYMKNAKERNVAFDLTFEEFCSYQNECFYCGDKFYGIRLDRVDNTKGYIKGNVVSCCVLCNSMKTNLKVNDFKGHIKKIYKKSISVEL